MKIGDLVRCTWQPRTERVDTITEKCIPMKHEILNKLGIITKVYDNRVYTVFFPDIGYEHPLAASAFEVINESRFPESNSG